MHAGDLIAVVGSAVVLAFLVLLALGMIVSRCRERCPACGERRLRLVQLLRGRPSSWGYFVCERCGARFRRHVGGEFELAAEDEWDRYCSPDRIL